MLETIFSWYISTLCVRKQSIFAHFSWLFICFLFALALIVIASSHIVDKKVHQIAKLNEEVNELKSEFVDVRSRLQRVRLESSLLEQLESKGLKQPEKPPQKIKVIIEE